MKKTKYYFTKEMINQFENKIWLCIGVGYTLGRPMIKIVFNVSFKNCFIWLLFPN